MNTPAALLPYQQRLLVELATSRVVVYEKSRRIGITWGLAADAVLTSAKSRVAKNKADRGMDTFYIGYNLDMTREFIDTCANWAKAFDQAAGAVEETLFNDGEKDIKAFRIPFASGFEIMALTSKPRSLRGRQGFVVLDEAAFHDDLPELIKAAMALLMWGGKVLIISTHDGADNPFNELVVDCRSGKRPFKVLRTTFDDALADGLYQRICLVAGEPWSPEAEAQWRQEIIDFYGDDADEELFCVPKNSGGVWLPRALVEARMDAAAPVLRWTAPDGFATRGDQERWEYLQTWLEGEVEPLLALLPRDARTGFGEDFGRTGDLTVFAPWVITQQLVCRFPFVVELRDCPFRQQEQALFFILDRLPRFDSGAMDARGNGQFLAEVAAQRYGADRIEQVMLSEGWYRDHTAPFKAAFEDGTVELPRDADLLDDLRAFEVVNGIPRIPARRGKGRDGQGRHGDAGIALLLGHHASRREVGSIEYLSSRARSPAAGGFAGDRRGGWAGY